MASAVFAEEIVQSTIARIHWLTRSISDPAEIKDFVCFVSLVTGDVAHVIATRESPFDAILLDVDNGPGAVTTPVNQTLYSVEGIHTCREALSPTGTLSVWSAQPDKGFERRITKAGLKVRRYAVPAYKNAKTFSRYIWVAAFRDARLPPGGGKPRTSRKKAGGRRRTRSR